MALTYVDALILYSASIQKTVEFYRSIGLLLEEEVHEEGPLHFACELGRTHIAVYEGKSGEALPRGTGGANQIGFQVDSLDDVFSAATKAGAPILIPPQEVPWGKRAVVQDPDGRPVELNQANNK